MRGLALHIAILCAAGLSAPASAQQTQPSTEKPPALEPSGATSPRPGTRTGKERLTSKAAYEKRTDDCNVPPELRTKARPASCDPRSGR